VDQEQLGNTVNDAVRSALSGDGGRVSHAHLTVALDNSREGLIRQLEGTIASTRAGLLDSFSQELGNSKEATWDALSSLRGRVDDLERTVEQSNTEMVSVLNKKACVLDSLIDVCWRRPFNPPPRRYKQDVQRALAGKAEKDMCMAQFRLKADKEKVRAARASEASARERSERNRGSLLARGRSEAGAREGGCWRPARASVFGVGCWCAAAASSFLCSLRSRAKDGLFGVGCCCAAAANSLFVLASLAPRWTQSCPPRRTGWTRASGSAS
jgi:hypothetical protein